MFRCATLSCGPRTKQGYQDTFFAQKGAWSDVGMDATKGA